MVKPTVISTFAGCGGSSLGYKWAGYKELLAIDFDDNSVEVFEKNFDVPIWKRDIKEVTIQEILDFTGLREGELDVLDGSPPCQGFSTAGQRKAYDERNELSYEFIRLLRGLKPKAFVMENVPGMAKGTMKGIFNKVTQQLKDSGYNVKVRQMNSMYYGVPQSRQRIIWIGIRKDIGEPSFPEPNHALINVGDAIADLNEEDESMFLRWPNDELWDKLKPGENGSAVSGNKWFNHVKVSWHKPAPTILKVANHNYACMMHPFRKRLLTIAELKRLSTFPDDFEFIGKWQDQHARIGNAVMPKFMQAIAEHVKDIIYVPK